MHGVKRHAIRLAIAALLLRNTPGMLLLCMNSSTISVVQPRSSLLPDIGMNNHLQKTIFLFICAVFVVFALGACHKDKKDQPKSPAVESNVPTAEPAQAPNAEPAQAHNAEQAQARCEKWPDNPLFQQDHEFVYQIKSNESACCDIEGPGWKCNKTGECERKLSFETTCRVDRLIVEKERCSSVVSCTVDESHYKDVLDNTIMPGPWGISEDGIFHIEERFVEPKDNLFDAVNLFISHAPSTKDDSNCDDNEFCHSEKVQKKGDEWCTSTNSSGGDYHSDEICIDFKRGITSMRHEFSGGFNQEVTCSLIK